MDLEGGNFAEAKVPFGGLAAPHLPQFPPRLPRPDHGEHGARRGGWDPGRLRRGLGFFSNSEIERILSDFLLTKLHFFL